MGPLPRWLPSKDLIYHLYQLFKHHVDQRVAADAQLRYQKYKWSQTLDKKDGHSKKAFALARGPVVSQVHKLASVYEETAICITTTPDDGQVVAELAVEDPQKFHLHFPLDILGQKWWIHNMTSHTIEVHTSHADELPEEVLIRQVIEHFDKDAIFHQLNDFWSQYWQRDSQGEHVSAEDQQAFQAVLTALPADLVHITVDQFDLQRWMEAIRATKTLSAPGTDGVRAVELQMMPPPVIQSLIEVVTQEPGIMPASLMQGRTIPIPKVQTTCQVHQVRPITILPQIYRIWAKMVTSQILASLSSQLPPPITGFLKNRSAYRAAYDMQHWLEVQAHQGNPRGGVTLDLIKCYNLIRRQFAIVTMSAFHVPDDVIASWTTAMQHLTRFWELSGEASVPTPTTAGCTEGDPLAVAIMVMIGAVWVFNAPWQNPALRLNAYADNWSWATVDSALHEAVSQATAKVCHAGRLQIDATKTWMWATCPEQVMAIRQALQQLLPGSCVEKLMGAKDLGFQLQYMGLARPGCLKDRLETGARRLRNILHQDWDLDVKLHVIKSSIYAAAFHGTEVYCLSPEDFQRFRSLVAQCLTQDYARNQTPVLCTMLLTPKLFDPELFVILQAIKMARRWLLQATLVARQTFLRMSSHHQGHASTKGPATVLKEYLLRLGWQISPIGNLTVGPFTTLNIIGTSFKTLSWWAHRTWNETAIVMHSRRFKLFNFPRTDAVATAEVLNKFDVGSRKLLLRELAQAFQTGRQKSKWTQDDSTACLFCNEPDSKEHRMLHCPAMESVRQNHMQAVQILQDDYPGWIDHPVVFAHPLQDFITQLHCRMPDVVIPEDAKNMLSTVQAAGLTLYSDGSSQHQAHPSTRFASFALVADLAMDDATRLQQADRFLVTGQEPDTMSILAQGRVQGLQGIHKAELSIIVIACESFDAFSLYTDSAVALSAIERARHAHDVIDFEDHPDFDLMLRLHKALKITHVFHKIKAHLQLRDHACNVQLYHQLGNKKANDAAIQANRQLFPDTVKEFEQYHADILQEQQKLKIVYNYIVELQLVKTKVDLHNPHLGAAEQCKLHATDPCELFSTWSPASFWTAPRPVQAQGLEMCPYGQQVAFATLKFLMQCKWPTHEYGPLPDPVGISWLEIALAIMLELGAYLPVKRLNSEGEPYPVFLHTYTDAMTHHTTTTEQSEQARFIFAHVNDMVPERLYPDVPRGQVKSLYMMGDMYFTTGLLLRPAFPTQQRVMSLVKQILKSNRSIADLGFSRKQQWQKDLDKTNWPWTKRLHEASNIRRRVRLVRNSAPA
eukprot:s2507_g8.t1